GGGMGAPQLDEFRAEDAERAAGAEHAARAAGGVAHQVGGGGAGMKADVLRVEAKRCGDDLGKYRFVSLARGLREREERHGAVAVEFHRALVLRHGARAARLEIGRDANAAELACAARPRGSLRVL